MLLPAHLKQVGEIDEFKGRWNAVADLSPGQLHEMQRVAVIESVASSTRIEGARLTNGEVQALLADPARRRLKSRDEQEVAGYAAAAARVAREHAVLPVSEETICELHRELLQYSRKDAAHAGTYKKRANHIEAFDADGRSLGIVLETVSPGGTPAAMVALVRDYAAAAAAPDMHPLLAIALFTVQFLAIHPFLDGNGRLSRLLSTLLLLKAGYTFVPYCSLEKLVEAGKADYYLALRQAQETLGGDNAGLHHWITYFLGLLHRQVLALKARIGDDGLAAQLPPLSRDLLLLARSRRRITVAAAVRATGANRNTVKVHLARLVDQALLARRGQRKGTWYEPAAPRAASAQLHQAQ